MKAPDEMVHAYMQAAMFTQIPEDQLPSGEFQGDPDDLSYGLWKRGRKVCDAFVLHMSERATKVCDDDDRWEECGRDFWYTSQEHGCGFWDGDWTEAGIDGELTALAETHGDDCYFGLDVTDHFLIACDDCDDC